MSADSEVLVALILQHTKCKSSHCYSATSKASADEAARAILRTGFRVRDPDLERRVDQLEKWTRGEF